MGRGRRGGGQFRRTDVRRNVGQRNRPWLCEPWPTLPDTRSEQPPSALPAHMVSLKCHRRWSGKGRWKPRGSERGMVSVTGHRKWSGRGGWKPRCSERGMVSVMGHRRWSGRGGWKPRCSERGMVSVTDYKRLRESVICYYLVDEDEGGAAGAGMPVGDDAQILCEYLDIAGFGPFRE